MNTTTVRDWSKQLESHPAIQQLARAIYAAQGTVYHSATNLDQQPPRVRQQFVGIAADLVKMLSKPDHALFTVAVQNARDEISK
jgi:hypothetical protein